MELILKFTDPSQSFCNGVEVGRILEKMQKGDDNVMNNGFPVNLENKAVLESACNWYGYTPFFGATYYDEWIEFIGIKKSFSIN